MGFWLEHALVRRRPGLSQLFSASLSFFGFFAGFQSQILRSKANADLLQEIIWRTGAAAFQVGKIGREAAAD